MDITKLKVSSSQHERILVEGKNKCKEFEKYKKATEKLLDELIDEDTRIGIYLYLMPHMKITLTVITDFTVFHILLHDYRLHSACLF